MSRPIAPTAFDIKSFIDILHTLTHYPYYTTYPNDKYTELTHLALTCQIATIMFELVTHEQSISSKFINHPLVHRDYLPRIALYHALERYVKCDILPSTCHRLFDNSPDLKSEFDYYIFSEIYGATSEDFYYHISRKSFKHILGCVFFEESFEYELFKASNALATYYELLEQKSTLEKASFEELFEANSKELQKYSDFPIIRELLSDDYNACENEYEKWEKLFLNFSFLRNNIRWLKRNHANPTSVLGHSFEVAVYTYLLCLAKDRYNQDDAELGFFVGLFHDIAERWTGDIPSCLKDEVDGLRKRTEELEIEVLETEVFPLLPGWLIPNFKGLMLELLTDAQKQYYKFADNLSAYIEAANQLALVRKDTYLENCIFSGINDAKKFSPVAKVVMNKVIADAKIPRHKVWFHNIKHFFTTLSRKLNK